MCVSISDMGSAIKPSGGLLGLGSGDQPNSSIFLIDQLFLITWGLVLSAHTHAYIHTVVPSLLKHFNCQML